ncbi:MAG: hypothetical protein WKF35_10870 [Ferruginibacter sp.]
MEKNYNTDNFEQFLRETTDDFRMYPSRRVWHSLYNDLHPGRKWPSFAVLLLLITSIIYIGVSNPTETGISKTKTIPSAKTFTSLTVAKVSDPSIKNNSQIAYVNAATTVTPSVIYNSSSLAVSNNIRPIESEVLKNVANITPGSTDRNNISSNEINKGSLPDNGLAYVTAEIKTPSDKNFLTPGLDNNTELFADNGNKLSDLLSEKEVVKKSIITLASTDNDYEDKAWIDNYLLYNKKPSRNWKNRMAYQVYVTPSVGYRTLKKNTTYSPPPVNSILANPRQVNTMGYTMNHQNALNLEAGTSIILNISKKFNVKAGIQLNYTNYTITAYELNHPTSTTLMLNDLNNGYPYLDTRSTTIANSPGLSSKYLNNNTYQVSLPVGVDYKIAGKNKLKWYAGLTLQPTYVSGGNSYLISSDLKNYVSGDEMIRKLNFNGGLETFLSYKIKNGVSLTAGPQVRYQFLSTYSKQITYDEKLYNYGIKLGMTKSF